MSNDSIARAVGDTASSRRIAKALKSALALVFVGLGGWCVLAPGTVETLALNESYRQLSPSDASQAPIERPPLIALGSATPVCLVDDWATIFVSTTQALRSWRALMSAQISQYVEYAEGLPPQAR